MADYRSPADEIGCAWLGLAFVVVVIVLLVGIGIVIVGSI